MKLGIFGGTFDPPHLGHLIVAAEVLAQRGLDRVIFVPAALPPHKGTSNITGAGDRLDMVRCAVDGNPSFEVSDIEIRRGGVSYTVDTLLEFARLHPGDGLYLMIGLDNLADFLAWKEPEKILGLAHVVVMSRPGATVELADIPQGVDICNVPEIGISSSEIRRRVKENRPIRYLVPDRVARVIDERGLYRT